MITSNSYVFISKAPFFHTNIEALISDPWVTYFNITGESGNNSYTNLPINNIYGQYIMILSTNDFPLFIDELDIYGNSVDFSPSGSIEGPPLPIPYGDGGPWIWPNDPPVFPPYIVGPPFVWIPPYIVGPNGTGVWPWWSSQEICNDGIDNDENGLTDCDDYPCGVGTFNVVKTDPSCPICNNGKICVYSGNQIKKVSVDNGTTWVNFPSSGFYCFDNLSDGTYNVKVQTQYGCEDGKQVVLQSPIGQSEICENGGFEEGTFNNWELGLSSKVYPTPSDFNNIVNNPAVSPRNMIISAPFVDPKAPFITIDNGSYIARLGDEDMGSESELLRYCFVVNSDNINFRFRWAALIEQPDHIGSGYFEYRIFNSVTGQSILGPNRTISSDPLLTPVGDDWMALGWQCENVDLSSFIGQQVCAEFITSNCTLTGHGSYAYIDGLCDIPSAPAVQITSANKFCNNQKINLEATGTGYESYQWEISKLDNSGTEFDKVVLPKTGGFQAPPISDLEQLYVENSNFTISCPQTLQVTFRAFTDCTEPAVFKKIIKIDCAEYNIEYCDPLYYCISANQNQMQIKGINDCDNCKYEWSSPQGISGMINTTSKFPTLDKSLNFLAFDKEYNVKVRTPEGCEYYDTFTMLNPEINISVNPIVIDNHCSYNINGFVSLNFEAPIGLLKAKATNVLTGETMLFPLIGTGLNRTFQINIITEIETQYEIEVFMDNGYFCKTGNCFDRLLLNKVKKSPFHTQWKAAWPNVFCNNTGFMGVQCDDLNDRFNLTFNSVKNLNCNEVNSPQNSSIYYYNLKIYDRWGNLMFEGTVFKLPTDDFGITGREPAVTWDGLFNGEEPVSGVFTWTAKVKSCYSSSNYCNNCGPTQNFQYCGSGDYDNDGYEIFSGDITLLN